MIWEHKNKYMQRRIPPRTAKATAKRVSFGILRFFPRQIQSAHAANLRPQTGVCVKADFDDSSNMIPDADFRIEVETIMRKSVSFDYVNDILDHETNTGDTIFECIKKDVEVTSAWYDEQYYNDSDIKLAIGRVILEQLGL